MKRLMLIAVVLFQPGCSLGTAMVHNICSEAKLATEDMREKKQNRRLAEQAWDAKCQADYERVFSDDYRQGFKDGFVDYLEAGGTGLPPSLPPQRYWATRYQTPEGLQAIEDWYAGFRAGAAAAQESGQRDLITLPTPRRPVEVTIEPARPVIPEMPPPAVVPIKPMREAIQKMPPATSTMQPTPKTAPGVTPVLPVLIPDVKVAKPSIVTRPSVPMTPTEGVVILPAPIPDVKVAKPIVVTRPSVPMTPMEGVVILQATFVEEQEELRPSAPARLGSPTTQPPPNLDLPRITTTAR